MKIGLLDLAEILGIHEGTLYGMIQAKIITSYEETPQKRKRYFFSEDDVVPAMITYELMSFGISRKQAAEMGSWFLQNPDKPFQSKTGIAISIDIEKYRNAVHSAFEKKF